MFTFDNLASPDQRDRNVVRMAAVVLAIFNTRPGRSVLLHNGGTGSPATAADGVEFDSDRDDWTCSVAP